jgi:predicted O-methyltransferase YrrM
MSEPMGQPIDSAILKVLAVYEERAEREQQVMLTSPAEFAANIEDYLICIGPEAGQLLHLLAVASKAQCIVELGASYGYSTIWLADAARRTGGKVHSLELSAKKVAYATEQLRGLGLEAYVQFHLGDARESLAKLPGPIDFVLIDLWKNLYCPCFELLHPKLAAGALVAADNMTFPPNARPDAQAYQQLVRTKADMDSLLLPVGNGIELSRKAAAS